MFGGIQIEFAKKIVKEFEELEEARRKVQYDDVLTRFSENAKNGNVYALVYYAVLYDEVRKKLEENGFKVKVRTIKQKNIFIGGDFMFYPEEFKSRVLEVYPDQQELHQRLHIGDEMVGRYLDDARQNSLPLDVILTATDLEELKEKARALQKQDALYAEWLGLYKEQRDINQ